MCDSVCVALNVITDILTNEGAQKGSVIAKVCLYISYGIVCCVEILLCAVLNFMFD